MGNDHNDNDYIGGDDSELISDSDHLTFAILAFALEGSKTFRPKGGFYA